MHIPVDEAIGVLEKYLKNQKDADWVEEAVESIIAVQHRQGLELVTEALYLYGKKSYLEPLWQIVRADSVGYKVRAEALRAISAVLVTTDAALKEIEQNRKPRTPPLLTREEVDTQVEQLLTLHDQTERRAEIRQLALEMAACISDSERIRKAGHTAINSDDPQWIASGIFVLRNSEKQASLPTLKRFLDHPDRGVRYEVIQGLADVGGPGELDMLEDLILDGSGEPQNTAMWSLSKVDSNKAGDLLAEAARWFDGELGVMANAAYVHWCENWPRRDKRQLEATSRHYKLPERLRVDGVYFRRESFSDRIICD